MTPQVLVRWQNQLEEDATWEDYDRMAKEFPDFIREDTNFVKGEGVQRGPVDLGITVGISELKGRKKERRERGRNEGQPVLSDQVTDSGSNELKGNQDADKGGP